MLFSTDLIVKALTDATQSQRIVEVAYAFGSRPGISRPVFVIEVNTTTGSFLVQEPPGNPDAKTYVIKRVLWVENPDGKRAHNLAAIIDYNRWRAREDTLKTALHTILYDPTKCSAESFEITTVLKGSHSNRTHNLYSIRRKEFSNTTLIQTLSDEDAVRVCHALHIILEVSESRVWDLLGVFARAEFHWPEWIKYKQNILAEGTALRAGRPLLRERKSFVHMGSLERGEQLAIYDKSVLRPRCDDREYGYFDRLRFFESAETDWGVMFALSKKIHPADLASYLKEASNNAELTALPSVSISTETILILKKFGLLVTASDAPLKALLIRMRASALSAPIKARKIKLPVNSISAYREFYEENMDADFEKSLRASPYLEGMYVFLPPAPWTWEQLQDFRTNYVEMVRALCQRVNKK